jgi:acyl carrier protein
MTLGDRLTVFIQQNLVGDESTRPIGKHDSLIDRGVIDSMGLFQLMTFIEQETGIRIPDEEVLPENFETVATMELMVQRLQARA